MDENYQNDEQLNNEQNPDMNDNNSNEDFNDSGYDNSDMDDFEQEPYYDEQQEMSEEDDDDFHDEDNDDDDFHDEDNDDDDFHDEDNDDDDFHDEDNDDDDFHDEDNDDVDNNETDEDSDNDNDEDDDDSDEENSEKKKKIEDEKKRKRRKAQEDKEKDGKKKSFLLIVLGLFSPLITFIIIITVIISMVFFLIPNYARKVVQAIVNGAKDIIEEILDDFDDLDAKEYTNVSTITYEDVLAKVYDDVYKECYDYYDMIIDDISNMTGDEYDLSLSLSTIDTNLDTSVNETTLLILGCIATKYNFDEYDDEDSWEKLQDALDDINYNDLYSVQYISKETDVTTPVIVYKYEFYQTLTYKDKEGNEYTEDVYKLVLDRCNSPESFYYYKSIQYDEYEELNGYGIIALDLDTSDENYNLNEARYCIIGTEHIPIYTTKTGNKLTAEPTTEHVKYYDVNITPPNENAVYDAVGLDPDAIYVGDGITNDVQSDEKTDNTSTNADICEARADMISSMLGEHINMFRVDQSAYDSTDIAYMLSSILKGCATLNPSSAETALHILVLLDDYRDLSLNEYIAERTGKSVEEVKDMLKSAFTDDYYSYEKEYELMQQYINCKPFDISKARMSVLCSALSLANAVNYNPDSVTGLPSNSSWNFAWNTTTGGLNTQGYIQWVLWDSGVVKSDIYSNIINTYRLENNLNEISKKALQPGDIGVVFKAGQSYSQNIMGIYLGKDEEGSDVWISCNGLYNNVHIFTENDESITFNYFYQIPGIDSSEHSDKYDCAIKNYTTYMPNYKYNDVYIMAQFMDLAGQKLGSDVKIALGETVLNRASTIGRTNTFEYGDMVNTVGISNIKYAISSILDDRLVKAVHKDGSLKTTDSGNAKKLRESDLYSTSPSLYTIVLASEVIDGSQKVLDKIVKLHTDEDGKLDKNFTDTNKIKNKSASMKYFYYYTEQDAHDEFEGYSYIVVNTVVFCNMRNTDFEEDFYTDID